MVDTKRFYDYLIANKLDFFAGVPDSLLKNLCACIKANSPASHNIITANEGNAVATAAGYYMATGRYGVVYMQNSGLGNTVNPLLSLADELVYAIPMLLVIGWRGEPGTKDEPQHKKQGIATLPLLDAMNIEYRILDDNYAATVDECCRYLETAKKPIALVIRKGLFSPYTLLQETNPYTMTREQALDAILARLGDNDFVVSTTGKTSREVFELREAHGQGHENDFLTVGSMGHTASIAFGMAAGTDKDIYTVDGDGSFLMHMGGFAVIAQNAGKNFKYILINNGAHESVGGQPTVAFQVDIPAILHACGFERVETAQTPEEIDRGMRVLKDNARAALIVYTKQGSRDDLGRPTTTPIENKEALMRKLQG